MSFYAHSSSYFTDLLLRGAPRSLRGLWSRQSDSGSVSRTRGRSVLPGVVLKNTYVPSDATSFSIRPPYLLATGVDRSLAAWSEGVALPSDEDLDSQASVGFFSDLLSISEEPVLQETAKSSVPQKRPSDSSSSKDPKKKKTSATNNDRRLGMPVSNVLEPTPLSAEPSVLGHLRYSSTLARYATANPYEVSKPPEPAMVEGPASEATLAMLHALRMKGLDVPTASYSTSGVSVSFPSTVWAINGGTASNVLDSLPHAKDWRHLNRMTSVELIRQASVHEIKVLRRTLIIFFENILLPDYNRQ